MFICFLNITPALCKSYFQLSRVCSAFCRLFLGSTVKFAILLYVTSPSKATPPSGSLWHPSATRNDGRPAP